MTTLTFILIVGALICIGYLTSQVDKPIPYLWCNVCDGELTERGWCQICRCIRPN